ncbi:MAG: hypothetical protein ACLFN5_04120, partial [bacterium]
MINKNLKTGLFLIISIFVLPCAATAGFHIGPMRAVEERTKELDESVNEHWSALWEEECKT